MMKCHDHTFATGVLSIPYTADTDKADIMSEASRKAPQPDRSFTSLDSIRHDNKKSIRLVRCITPNVSGRFRWYFQCSRFEHTLTHNHEYLSARNSVRL